MAIGFQDGQVFEYGLSPPGFWAAGTLGEGLQHRPNQESISMCNSGDDVGPATLRELLAENTNLRKLRLDGCGLSEIEIKNGIGDLSLPLSVRQAAATPALRHGGVSAMNLLSPRSEHRASTFIGAAPIAPSFIAKASLRSLDLSRNSLQSLPKELFLLPRLGALNASSNNLNGLPGELWACTSLRRLELQCNPLGAGFWERGPRPRKVRPHLGDDLLTAYSDRQTAYHPSELPAPPIAHTAGILADGGAIASSVSGGGLLPFDSGGGGAPRTGGGVHARGRSSSVSSGKSRRSGARWRQNRIAVFPPEPPAWVESRARKAMAGAPAQWGVTLRPDGTAPLSLPLLQYVDISGCRVTELPDTIAGLVGLATLKANDNELRRLPDALAALPSLLVLELERNPLLRVPPALQRRPGIELVTGLPVRVCEGLYIGDKRAAHNVPALEARGIQRVVNVTTDVRPPRGCSIDVLLVSAHDLPTQELGFASSCDPYFYRFAALQDSKAPSSSACGLQELPAGGGAPRSAAATRRRQARRPAGQSAVHSGDLQGAGPSEGASRGGRRGTESTATTLTATHATGSSRRGDVDGDRTEAAATREVAGGASRDLEGVTPSLDEDQEIEYPLSASAVAAASQAAKQEVDQSAQPGAEEFDEPSAHAEVLRDSRISGDGSSGLDGYAGGSEEGNEQWGQNDDGEGEGIDGEDGQERQGRTQRLSDLSMLSVATSDGSEDSGILHTTTGPAVVMSTPLASAARALLSESQSQPGAGATGADTSESPGGTTQVEGGNVGEVRGVLSRSATLDSSVDAYLGPEPEDRADILMTGGGQTARCSSDFVGKAIRAGAPRVVVLLDPEKERTRRRDALAAQRANQSERSNPDRGTGPHESHGVLECPDAGSEGGALNDGSASGAQVVPGAIRSPTDGQMMRVRSQTHGMRGELSFGDIGASDIAADSCEDSDSDKGSGTPSADGKKGSQGGSRWSAERGSGVEVAEEATEDRSGGSSTAPLVPPQRKSQRSKSWAGLPLAEAAKGMLSRKSGIARASSHTTPVASEDGCLAVESCEDDQASESGSARTGAGARNERMATAVPMLVHCVAGLSRSATVCTALLMRTRRLTLREAFLVLKTARPGAAPNLGFFTQLQAFEQTLLRAGVLTDEDVRLARTIFPLHPKVIAVRPLGLLPPSTPTEPQSPAGLGFSASARDVNTALSGSGNTPAGPGKRRPGSLSLREYSELLDASRPPRVTLARLALWRERGYGPASPAARPMQPKVEASSAATPPSPPRHAHVPPRKGGTLERMGPGSMATVSAPPPIPSPDKMAQSEYKAPSLFLPPAPAPAPASEYKAPSLFLPPVPAPAPEYKAPTLLLGLRSSREARDTASASSVADPGRDLPLVPATAPLRSSDRPASASSLEESDTAAEVMDVVADLTEAPVAGSHATQVLAGDDSKTAAAAAPAQVEDPDDEIDWMAEGFWYSEMVTSDEKKQATERAPAPVASSGAGDTAGGMAAGASAFLARGSASTASPALSALSAGEAPVPLGLGPETPGSHRAGSESRLADVVIEAARRRGQHMRSGSVVVRHDPGLRRPKSRQRKAAAAAMARRALAKWKRKMERLPPSLRRGKPSQWGRRHSIHEISRDVALKLLQGGATPGTQTGAGAVPSGGEPFYRGPGSGSPAEGREGSGEGAAAGGGGTGGRLHVVPGSAADVQQALRTPNSGRL